MMLGAGRESGAVATVFSLPTLLGVGSQPVPA